MMNTCTYALPAMLEPSDDINGVWCSTCPSLDIMSCGDDASHAAMMLCDALESIFTWNVEDELNPFDRESFDPDVARLDEMTSRMIACDDVDRAIKKYCASIIGTVMVDVTDGVFHVRWITRGYVR